MANKTGLSKSSVHRHQQALLKRNQHSESFFWETAVGAEWLTRLVIAVLYVFGIKNHIGADQLSEFFSLLRLDTHVGISPSALRSRLRQMECLLPMFQQAHEQSAVCPMPQRTVALDETFFQKMMVLVLLDLPSGYLLLEEQAADRSFGTWQEKASSRLRALNLEVKHAISDRAKALIKLALNEFHCHAGADLFHGQYELSRWFPASLVRAKKKAAKVLVSAQEALVRQTGNETAHTAEFNQLQEQVAQAAASHTALEKAHDAYRQHQEAISLAVHPFSLSTQQQNSAETVAQDLQTEIDALDTLAQSLEIPDKHGALEKFRRQINELGSHVSAWWLWVNSLLADVESPLQQWVTNQLLPVVYWHHQLQRNKKASQRKQYRQAWQEAARRLTQAHLPEGLTKDGQKHWQSWCEDKVKHFHRASSAVEGRNGCLAQMYHNGRGLTTNRLKAQTVIHNYGIRREDGSTAASRLFGKPSPDLFEWLLTQMGEPPLPRKRRGKAKLNPLILIDVPA